MPSPDASKNWVAKKSSEYSPIFAASCRMGPGSLLALVPLGRGGPDHLRRELMHPVAHLAQVTAQLQGEPRRRLTHVTEQ